LKSDIQIKTYGTSEQNTECMYMYRSTCLELFILTAGRLWV